MGVPEPGARLPTKPLSYDPSTVVADGLPSNMCILRGFPTTLAKSVELHGVPVRDLVRQSDHPVRRRRGAGDDTYSSTATYTNAAASTSAGLQKWVYDASSQSWTLAYTLQAGLDLGDPYIVAGYPVGDNAATSLPWAPATDGLRNISGRVNPDGSVTIWGVTSTVSGNGDQGADPNQLVAITDQPAATTPSTDEQFQTVVAPTYAQVVRGVSLTPDSHWRWSGSASRH